MAPVLSSFDRPEGQHPRRSDLGFASVVHVNEKGGNFGGTEEYIALVTSALNALGVRSHLVCGVVSGALPPGLESVHVVPELASRRPRPGTGAALAGVVAELDPDVVYVHNVFDPMAVAALAGMGRRRMVLWYVHDHYVTCLSELRWRRDIGSCPHALGRGCVAAIEQGHCILRYPDRPHAGTELERRMTLCQSLEAADAIVVVSGYMRELLREARPALDGRLHQLSRPIRDLGEPRPRRRTQPDDPAVVAYAGRITAEKGLAIVIEALGAVACGTPVELCVAGVVENADYWSQCQERQAAAVERNPHLTITYLGHLDYDAMDELFRRSDIVTIPSQWPEPLGAVALEAMSAGAAVIASRVGGLEGTVRHGHNGLHVAPGDVDSWTGALTALLQHPEQADRLGRQAHGDARRVTIADHLEDLAAVVSTHRPRQPHSPPTG